MKNGDKIYTLEGLKWDRLNLIFNLMILNDILYNINGRPKSTTCK